MPTRFDHAIIAARDLDAAIKQFQHLGFDVQPGGRHTGRGTYNGLFRFGLDYVELLSVYDETEARVFAAGEPIILDGLRDRGQEAALVGYALATEQIEEDAKRFKGGDATFTEPEAMQRKRPDGNTLSWRKHSPGNLSWNRPWPFLIQWDTPDEQRLQIDLPGMHPNGATGWVWVAVATHDLESTLDVYQNQLGLELVKGDSIPELAARRATFQLGKGKIELLGPDGDGPLQRILSENGEGPFELGFVSKDLKQTRAFLQQRSIAFEDVGPGKLAIAPGEALGVRIHLLG